MSAKKDAIEQARKLVAQGEGKADPGEVQKALQDLIKTDPEGFAEAMRSK